jgi:hypothetical protein
VSSRLHVPVNKIPNDRWNMTLIAESLLQRLRLWLRPKSMEGAVKHMRKVSTFSLTTLFLLVAMPAVTNAQMSKVKTVWVILMENHNWTGNNSGAKFGDPDIKGSLRAPYANGQLLDTAAHAEQYFNPPGNHPSQPNYLWLEAGTNFGVLADTQPGQPQLYTHSIWYDFLKTPAFRGHPTLNPTLAARCSIPARSISLTSTLNICPRYISTMSTTG